MKTTTLGKSDVIISEICLGTMTFGNQTQPADAFAQMDRAMDVGMSFFDCAEMYPVNPVRAETMGRSEEVIGDWVTQRGRSDDLQIATKISGPGISREEGFTGDNIATAIDDSLRRLRVDVIDLYQLHWPQRGSYAFRQNWSYDPSGQVRARTLAHMQDVCQALKTAVAAGKIRAFGLSNESAWGTVRWIDVAAQVGGPRVVAVQNEYSLMNRHYDLDMSEVAVNEDITLLSYSPLAAGLLTGKYLGGVTPADSRAGVDLVHGGKGDLGGRRTPQAERAVVAWKALADESGIDLIHLAIAFQTTRPFPVVPIIGATTTRQLEHLIAGLNVTLSTEVLDRIAQIRRDHPTPY